MLDIYLQGCVREVILIVKIRDMGHLRHRISNAVTLDVNCCMTGTGMPVKCVQSDSPHNTVKILHILLC